MVIVTFVRWVDRIARLGCLGGTIDKVETATADALQRRRCAPTVLGVPAGKFQRGGLVIHSHSIGYVQRVDVPSLQNVAEQLQLRITVAACPGTFSAPGQALAYVIADSGDVSGLNPEQIASAFLIGDDRKFDEGSRFGLIVLSEIAGRALSPTVNDPGIAIDIIGTFVRLFALWSEPVDKVQNQHSCQQRQICRCRKKPRHRPQKGCNLLYFRAVQMVFGNFLRDSQICHESKQPGSSWLINFDYQLDALSPPT